MAGRKGYKPPGKPMAPPKGVKGPAMVSPRKQAAGMPVGGKKKRIPSIQK